MLLELTHETVFEYGEPVSEAYMECRLTPVTDSSQHLLLHQQQAVPPVPIRQYVDAYGNTVSYLNLLAPHKRIEIRFDSVVQTHASPFRGQGLAGQDADSSSARLLLHDFLGPTALTGWCEELRSFAGGMNGVRDAGVREAAVRVAGAIHSRFRYEGGVTNVASPVAEVLKHGAGVCQDFAHVMLAVCRFLGYPARYASGYVLPEEGEAVASHAWCELFDPEGGWFGMDATHNQRVDERYILLGVGRDFRDVPPNRGVYSGHAAEEMRVRVNIRPMAAEELENRSRDLQPQPRARRPNAAAAKRPQPMSILEQSVNAQQQ